MKKIILLLSFCWLSGQVFAQQPYASQIKIKVSLIGSPDGDKYYLNSVEKYKIDSSIVTDGKLLFNYNGEPDALNIEKANDKKT